MTTYYVDDGGSATAPYDTWAKAATSLSALDDAVAFAADDIVYIGHDHVCQYVHTAHRTITGPNTEISPVKIISATQGSNPPVYQKSSTNQIDTSEGAYDTIFTGSFDLRGVKIKTGRYISTTYQYNRQYIFEDVTIVLPAGGYVSFSAYTTRSRRLTIDCSASVSSDMVGIISSIGENEGLVLVGSSNRWYVLGNPNSLDGADLSAGFSNRIFNVTAEGGGLYTLNNILTPATFTIHSYAGPYRAAHVFATNIGPADAPTYLYSNTRAGLVTSSSSIYRTGGATVEGDACSWLVATWENCSESMPRTTPWIYGEVVSTGSKTFDLYITNDTADFTDAEVWLELEYLASLDEAVWTLVTDQRATITTTAAAQTDDTTSTWVGSGPAFAYKQKLSITCMVGEVGQYRARVAIGKASIASSRYFYIDPDITVT